jgi:hypothetical protein
MGESKAGGRECLHEMVIRAMRPLLLIAPLAACGHLDAEPRKPLGAASARLALNLVEKRVPTRDDLRAYFVVTNTGSIPLWLNGRMLLGAGRASSPFNEVWVDAKGPGTIRWWCMFKTPPVEPRHYRMLLPGESTGRSPNGPSDDLRCLGLDEPGRYTLIAHYRDGNDPGQVPPTPPGSVYLGWELVSDPVTVEISEGSAGKAR